MDRLENNETDYKNKNQAFFSYTSKFYGVE